MTGCRDKKNGGRLLPRCLLLTRNRAGRATVPASETLSPGEWRRGWRAGLPGPHETPAAGTEPCRQPGRRRRSLPPVPAAFPGAPAAPPIPSSFPPLCRRLRAPPGKPPGGAARQGWALGPFGCLKSSVEHGKCRLTAGQMRGTADFVCRKY